MKIRDKVTGLFLGKKKRLIVCGACRKSFEGYESQNRKFCSKVCSLSCNKSTPPSQLGRHWKLSDETRGKQKLAAQKRLQGLSLEQKENYRKKITAALASPEVRRKMSLSLRGSRSPRWLGGRTKLTKLIRKGYKYAEWRKSCFERDSFTCVLCLKKGGRLEVDHYPKKFSSLFESNKITSLEEAEKCLDFWDVSNGRTLCVSCHKKETYN